MDEYKKFKRRLIKKSDKYWKTQPNKPTSEVACFLIAEFGVEDASAILKVKVLDRKEKGLLWKYLDEFWRTG